MRRKIDPRSRETWRKLLEQKQRSGLTVVEFCHRERLSPSAYYAWRRKLHGPQTRPTCQTAAMEQKVTQTRRKGKAAESRSCGAFVQVPLPAAASAGAWIEVTLAGGTVIRLPQQNLAALQTVLSAIGSAEPLATEELRYA